MVVSWSERSHRGCVWHWCWLHGALAFSLGNQVCADCIHPSGVTFSNQLAASRVILSQELFKVDARAMLYACMKVCNVLRRVTKQAGQCNKHGTVQVTVVHRLLKRKSPVFRLPHSYWLATWGRRPQYKGANHMHAHLIP